MRKILSLDGGGIKGVFTVSFLAEIEEKTGKKVSDYFDLIVGTSTGGIIALGLGLGFSAKEILHFYETYGSQVFTHRTFLSTIRRIFTSKYQSTGLSEALSSQFGERLLGESKTRLVIPSLHAETGEVYVYKTAHHERFKSDFKSKVVDVALATAAAPTYFPAHKTPTNVPLIDGGLWANNPMGMATVEAIGVLNWPRDSIKLLSIACPTPPLSIRLGNRQGISYWLTKVTDMMMTGQSSSSVGTAQLLIGHENVHRICPPTTSGRYGLDSIDEIPSLKGLGSSEARKAVPHLEKVFFTDKAERFVPIYK